MPFTGHVFLEGAGDAEEPGRRRKVNTGKNGSQIVRNMLGREKRNQEGRPAKSEQIHVIQERIVGVMT